MTIWITSDPHFGHKNMAEVFRDERGAKVRPFETVEEMDEALIERWNAVVRPSDHVWCLGDVAMRPADMHKVMPRLKGHKRLIRGNHDIFKTQVYLKAGWEEIRGCSVLDGMIFTHIPIHPYSLGRFRANVHGHTHNEPDYDCRYLNVSVERTDYRPISLDEVKARVEDKSHVR